MARTYIPDRGDLVWLNFDPQAGREQRGKRPALVLSPATYNRKTELAVVCPVTSQINGYPFEVALPAGLKVAGVILADQVKNLSWLARKASYAGAAGPTVLADVQAKIAALIL